MRILLIGASGYIGSRLARELVALGHTVVGSDTAAPVDPKLFESFVRSRYQDIPDGVLDDVDFALWFAGHSSVGLSSREPVESLKNNTIDLMDFCLRAAARNIPVVYASSASVLSSSVEAYSLVATEQRTNVYDAGKLAFDLVASNLGGQLIGLRMATVSGWSPRMRWDVVFNAMNRSATQEGRVLISNPSNFRSLLFIEDLVAYIEMTLRQFAEERTSLSTMQVPLGSWSGSIGTLGAEISRYWGVETEFGPDSGTYSFVISDRELQRAFDSPAAFYCSVAERCNRFAEQNEWSV